MREFKLISSLEKVFPESVGNDFNKYGRASVLMGERFSFQIYHRALCDSPAREFIRVEIESTTPCEIYNVRYVPVEMPVYEHAYDDNYLKTAPGLYPDILEPLHYGGKFSLIKNRASAVWVSTIFDTSGVHTIKVSLFSGDECVFCDSLTVEVIAAKLPPQELIFTQWFHCDCLANYYKCEAWSEEHWRIIENFARVAHDHGINMLLTPIFTPPLDTLEGGERTTVQLIEISVEDGKYSFDFSRLGRWIEMCRRIGIEYLEISHLFTQWGARHAPKIVATVCGKQKRIFGWETDATGDKYVTFLRTFLPQLLQYLKSQNIDKKCFFHISDEPNAVQLESYKAAKSSISDILDGYPIMDALSDYEFYKSGVVDMPIPSNNHIEPFINAGVKDLWTYYCCGQCIDVSNRFIAMPAWRNRSIGMQMYRYDIKGFLHWAYNFYNNMGSADAIDPYIDLSGEYWVPAGDAFSVYPSRDGSALCSSRLLVFEEAISDMRAMSLAQELCGRDTVVRAIEEAFGRQIRFCDCARSADEVFAVRAAVNELIRSKL